MRWLVQISGAEEAPEHTEYQAERQRDERRKRQQQKARRHFDQHRHAQPRGQAFWAMHVEALA